LDSFSLSVDFFSSFSSKSIPSSPTITSRFSFGLMMLGIDSPLG
jgi:hypothetical protein